MKAYFYMNLESFSNCYVVVNELTKQAIIIDPGKITKQIINQIEDNDLTLCSVLITHNHPGHTKGLSTLKKIYDVSVYAADLGIATNQSTVLKGDGVFEIAGLKVNHYSIPGHSSDSVVYKIENVFFTGDTLMAGTIAPTNNGYAKRILLNGIKTKILPNNDDTIIMPGHGPMSSLGAERMFNIDLD